MRVKRGRGRPPKNQQVLMWSEVTPGSTLEVDDERGQFIFSRMADNGLSATMYHCTAKSCHTFPVSKVRVVKLHDVQDDIEQVFD